MKTSRDPRHLARIKKIQTLFAWEFNHDQVDLPQDVVVIVDKLPEIDNYIESAAPQWPIEKINRMDLSILREAVFELMIGKTVPVKVIVDEAVEIAKSYGSESSPSFINGALGKLILDQKIA